MRLASYAPLLAKQGHMQWRPDMIYFDNTRILPSANYYVQQMFAQNSGDVYLPAKMDATETNLAVSCVRESQSGDVILKLVNVFTNAVSAKVDLSGVAKSRPDATRVTLTGDPGAVNAFGKTELVTPRTEPFKAAESFTCELRASSFTLIRVKTK